MKFRVENNIKLEIFNKLIKMYKFIGCIFYIIMIKNYIYC